MTVKDVARQVIDTLPDGATIDDIIHALYINSKFKHARMKSVKEKAFYMKMPRRNYRNG